MKTLYSKSMFFLTAVIMMAVAASCSLEEPLPCISDEIPEGAVIERISLEVDVPESLTPETKSSYSVEDVRRISNLNIFVYHDGRLLDGYSRYFADAKDVYMTFPPDKDGFDVYMFGNVGQVSAPAEESDIVNLQYVVDSYDDFRTEGFPVANSYMGYTKGSQTRFLVKRLVGQYSLSFENVSDIAEYTVKDLVFYNCARDIYPFGNGQAATMFFRDGDVPLPGDHLSAEDVETINTGGSVDLYFLENLQGVLLPTNTDPKNKVPDSVGESGKKCTYIRATVDIRTPAGQYTNGAYRFYCGSDATSDFSIRRNTRYTAKLNFNQDMVCEEEWRIEVDEPEEIGEFIFDKPYAAVIENVEDMVYITPVSGNHAELEYFIEYDASSEVPESYIQYELVDTYRFVKSGSHYVKVPCKGIHITTTYPVNGTYGLNEDLLDEENPKYKTGRLLVKSVDSYNNNSIKTTPLTVRVYDKMFPIGIKSSDGLSVRMYFNNPLGLGFKVETRWGKRVGGNLMPSTYVMRYQNAIYRFGDVYVDYDGLYHEYDETDYLCVSSSLSYRMSTKNFYDKCISMYIYPVNLSTVNNIIGYKGDLTNTCTEVNADEVILLYPRFIDKTYFLSDGSIDDGINDSGSVDNRCHYACGFEPLRAYTAGKAYDSRYKEYFDMSDSYLRFFPDFDFVYDDSVDNKLRLCYTTNGVTYSEIPTGKYDISSSGYCSYGFNVWNVALFGTKESNYNASRIFVTGCNRGSYLGDCNNPHRSKSIPFYIKNGGMMINSLEVYNTDPVKFKDITHRGVVVGCCAPGRDLNTSDSGALVFNALSVNLKQAGRHYNRWKDGELSGYTYDGIFLKINGCTCWPYCDSSGTGTNFDNVVF